jgi:uncharacterized phage-associated protein
MIRELYDALKEQYELDLADVPNLGNPDTLDESQKETVQTVLRDYGNKSAQWLRDLIVMERPWNDARKGLLGKEQGNREITLASMAEYYEGVYNEGFDIEP